jgi:hypothetical protein
VTAEIERVWRPDEDWTTDPEIVAGRRCRMIRCANPAVAALRRSYHHPTTGENVGQWWTYCADHLYGRRVRDGVVEIYAVPREWSRR